MLRLVLNRPMISSSFCVHAQYAVARPKIWSPTPSLFLTKSLSVKDPMPSTSKSRIVCWIIFFSRDFSFGWQLCSCKLLDCVIITFFYFKLINAWLASRLTVRSRSRPVRVCKTFGWLVSITELYAVI